MRFTLRQLALFVDAASSESFRQTAERFGISQPSVSNHIASLEKKIGARLFERRRGSHARLSAEGERLLEKARVLLRQADEVSRVAAGIDATRPVLRIAAGAYLIDHWLRPALPRYHALPGVPDVELIAETPGEPMLAALSKGRADVAVYTGSELDDPRVRAERLRQVSIGLYAAPPVAARAASGDLSAAPFIRAPAHSAVDDWLGGLFAGAGLTPRSVAARTQYPEMMLDLALRGEGVAVLFDDEAGEHLKSGRLVRLPVAFEPGYRWMVISRHSEGTIHPGALEFFRALLSSSKSA